MIDLEKWIEENKVQVSYGVDSAMRPVRVTAVPESAIRDLFAGKVLRDAVLPLRDEMLRQMQEHCSMKMRGAFIDGWLSAEAAHGIGDKA